MSRRWLAAEVVQTSNMDCGVAGLKCILDSFGINSNYEYLRDACKTDVNGTSIDRMEDVLNDIGFDCYQVVVPKEQVTYSSNNLFPAIAVVNIGQNITHFVVIWRQLGAYLQIVDPAQGRYWIKAKEFATNQLFVYRDHIEAEQWQHCYESWDREWFLEQSRQKLGIDKTVFRNAMQGSDESWKPGAKVDAVLRFITYLADQDSKFKGKIAQSLFNELIENLSNIQDSQQWYKIIPKAFWTCRCAETWYTNALEEDGHSDTPEMVNFSGAVLLRIQPSPHLKYHYDVSQNSFTTADSDTANTEPAAESPVEQPIQGEAQTQDSHEQEHEHQRHEGPEDDQVRQALSQPTTTPMSSLLSFIHTAGIFSPSIVFLSAIIVAATVTLQAVAFKLLFEFDNLIGPGTMRMQIAIVIFFVIAGVAVLNIPLQLSVQRISRRLEDQFRISLYEKLPRLKDEYFASRLLSDLIERSHSVASIENIPTIVVSLIQSITRMLLVFLGLIYIAPNEWLRLSLFMLTCLFVPFVAQQVLSQKDMVTRTLAGTLTRHYSNALLGLFTVKVHSGENTILNQQQESLTRWAKASNTQRISMIRLSFVQDSITYGMAALLIYDTVNSTSVSALNILYVYWLLQMPVRAEHLFMVVQQYPMVKNIILRLQEPLCSAEDPVEDAEPDQNSRYNQSNQNDSSNPDEKENQPIKGMHIKCRDAYFSVEGEPILDNINIDIKPGAHLAIVGASGAGKSTFVSSLLGFAKLDSGEMTVDGKPLNPQVVATVRKHSTWLDPQVYLFKASIIENITYGNVQSSHMGAVLDDANLWPLIEGLPNSIHTECGEAGSQLSGGEGQRIRLARALNKPDVSLALLDEPFRGLDKPTRQQLMKTVRSKWKDITLICVIHDVSEALQFDQVAVLEDGHIVEQGSPDELLQQNGSLVRLLNHETSVASQWLNNPKWRRISVKKGHIIEEPHT